MLIKSCYTKILVICTVISLLSCKQEIETYSGDSGVFFAMLHSGSKESSPIYTESSLLPFALTNQTDSTFLLRVKIIGAVSNVDRTVRFEIVAEKSTAVSAHDYDPIAENVVLKAGDIYAYIPIHFMRKSSLSGKEVTLTIRLLENDEFKLLMPRWLPISGGDKVGVDVIEHKLTVSDKYERLEGWSDSSFGLYSDKKIKLMCAQFGLTLKDFMPGEMEFVERKVLGQKLDKYLKEMQAQGQTVYEDYRDSEGNLVKMTSGAGIN